jgi:hypothetical protein
MLCLRIWKTTTKHFKVESVFRTQHHYSFREKRVSFSRTSLEAILNWRSDWRVIQGISLIQNKLQKSEFHLSAWYIQSPHSGSWLQSVEKKGEVYFSLPSVPIEHLVTELPSSFISGNTTIRTNPMAFPLINPSLSEFLHIIKRSGKLILEGCIQYVRLISRWRVVLSLSLSLHGLSPRANYTDRPNNRRLSAKLVPTFSERGCHMVSVTDPYGRNLDFLDRSRYVFFQVAAQLYSRGWVAPFQTHYLSDNLVALGFEPGPLDLQPGTLTTILQRRPVSSLQSN